jgi:hypothetical protein
MAEPGHGPQTYPLRPRWPRPGSNSAGVLALLTLALTTTGTGTPVVLVSAAMAVAVGRATWMAAQPQFSSTSLIHSARRSR